MDFLLRREPKSYCKLEKRDDSTAIYIDTSSADKWTSYLINENVYGEFYKFYRNVSPTEKLVVNIKTTGGYCSWCLMIANVILKHKGPTVAEIEEYAFSGGTVIALACDKIKITEIGALGPINPYLYVPVSTKHTSKLIEKYGWLSILHEYMEDRENSMKETMGSILANTGFNEKECTELLEFFVYKFEHNTPIHYHMFPECLKKITEIIEPISLSVNQEELFRDKGFMNNETFSLPGDWNSQTKREYFNNRVSEIISEESKKIPKSILDSDSDSGSDSESDSSERSDREFKNIKIRSIRIEPIETDDIQDERIKNLIILLNKKVISIYPCCIPIRYDEITRKYTYWGEKDDNLDDLMA